MYAQVPPYGYCHRHKETQTVVDWARHVCLAAGARHSCKASSPEDTHDGKRRAHLAKRERTKHSIALVWAQAQGRKKGKENFSSDFRR